MMDRIFTGRSPKRFSLLVALILLHAASALGSPFFFGSSVQAGGGGGGGGGGTPTPTPPPSGTVVAPGFTPNGGTFSASVVNVTISTSTVGAQIRYNVGANPVNPTSGSGTLISASSGTATINPTVGGIEIKAIAFKSGMTTSSVSISNTYDKSGL